MKLTDKINELNGKEMSYYQRWTELMEVVTSGAFTDEDIPEVKMIEKEVKKMKPKTAKPKTASFSEGAYLKSLFQGSTPKASVLSNVRLVSNGFIVTLYGIQGDYAYAFTSDYQINAPEFDVLVKITDFKSVVGKGISSIDLRDDILYINDMPVPCELNDDKFPEVETIYGETVVVEVSPFQGVIHSVSKNESRRFACGVLLDNDVIVTTDGKRLTKKECKTGIKDKILSLMFVKAFPKSGDVVMTTNGDKVQIKYNNITIITNFMEATFPPYASVMPNLEGYIEYDIPKIDSKKFKSFLKDEVAIVFDKDTLIAGDYKEVIPELKGNEIKFAVNYRYYEDALKFSSKLSIKHATSTIVFTGDNHYEIIMPMSIPEEV